MFAIYQILLGWKTYEYYYETNKLRNPRPTQPKKKVAKNGQNRTRIFFFFSILMGWVVAVVYNGVRWFSMHFYWSPSK